MRKAKNEIIQKNSNLLYHFITLCNPKEDVRKFQHTRAPRAPPAPLYTAMEPLNYDHAVGVGRAPAEGQAEVSITPPPLWAADRTDLALGARWSARPHSSSISR
ncbi:hypothetical protein EVAR_49132_1 [Eumeta japonica]|uniref:Uncharacterized protein n=1 Tax=Eumeta variegata TaxID=151549 RepID=A0A4C1YPA8_EUMVA|nr:hypothetical protein EVAR_49132_1 [Eumeta japonica]